MTTYYVMYSLIIITGIFFNSSKKEKKIKVVSFIGFITYFLILALRHPSMGVDLGYQRAYGYLRSFDIIGDMGWLETLFIGSFLNYETGYIFFNKIVASICLDQQFFLAICALLSYAPIYYIIYKYSKMPSLSYIIYLGLPVAILAFSGLRQSIAIGLCYIAFKYIKEKEIFKFIVLVSLASTFHSSAMMFLFTYPLYYLKLKNTTKLGSIVAIIVCYILRYPLFDILSKLFKENAIADNNSAVTLFLVFVSIYVYTLIFGENTPEVNGYRNIFYVACLCQSFGGVYSTAIRVGYYFMIPLMLLLPEILYRKTKQNIIMASVIGLCFIAFGLYSFSRGSWAMTNPWIPFW